MNFVPLGYGDVAIAAVLVLVNGLLSLWFALGLERQIAVATLRMVIQLVLVGLVLHALFNAEAPFWTLLAALVMIAFAGRESVARQERPFTGWWSYGLGTSTVLMAAGLVTVLALTTAVRPQPWYDPRFAIPLLGMILGNTMNGISLGLNTLTVAAARERNAIEARLALGATRWEALGTVTRGALKSGMLPIINSMSATGLVSLPGMMTGQILSGVAPEQAVKYQLLIMFLIAGSTALGSLAAVMLGAARLTDQRHRLRLDRLRPAR
ncbi:MAG TPA: iron export ABC transporter permease subunit FetB [Alphaproteobacteria bacterium]|nr:iron export ABC transporter permease subunit FetB [Alphaproteobacteria bacterium]